jgi:hypothetical protein
LAGQRILLDWPLDRACDIGASQCPVFAAAYGQTQPLSANTHHTGLIGNPIRQNPIQLNDVICRLNPSNRQLVIRIRELTSEPIRAYPYYFQPTCPLTPLRNIVMSKMNHHRPRFRSLSKTYESIDGSDVPTEFRNTPRFRKSKAELRMEAEEALRRFALQGRSSK